MFRKARTPHAVLVKSREIKHCGGGWGKRGKDDRKHNILAPLVISLHFKKRMRQLL
jgi:hypothetical protein